MRVWAEGLKFAILTDPELQTALIETCCYVGDKVVKTAKNHPAVTTVLAAGAAGVIVYGLANELEDQLEHNEEAEPQLNNNPQAQQQAGTWANRVGGAVKTVGNFAYDALMNADFSMGSGNRGRGI